jgi:hypothetical protein
VETELLNLENNVMEELVAQLLALLFPLQLFADLLSVNVILLKSALDLLQLALLMSTMDLKLLVLDLTSP